MRTSYPIALLAITAAAILSAGPAVAQPSAAAPSEPAVADGEPAPAPTDDQPARTEYERGAQAFAAGRYREAIEHFIATNRLSPNPALAYNIALAYDSMGDSASALRYYRDYLRALPQAEDRTEVTASIRRLEQRLAEWGVQQLTVMSDPAGGTLSVDGARVGVTPWTGELTPDSHHLEVTLPGYSPATIEVSLVEDRAIDVRVNLHAIERAETPAVESPPPEPAPARESYPPRPPRRLDTVEVVGIGALGLGVGSLLGAVLLERSRAAAEDEAVGAETQIAAAAELERIDRRRNAARIAAGIGAGLFVTGAAVIAIGWTSSKTNQRRGTRVGLGCDGQACGLTATQTLP
ncbi:MAG: PEGA domain-containing protein [Polyangiaceae bacterium]|nr:PEGA domain-containing protein [Polyangiaceae bacterium]